MKIAGSGCLWPNWTMQDFYDKEAALLLQTYGAEAERECADRAAYHRAKGDRSAAAKWERLGGVIGELRRIRRTVQDRH